MEQNGKWPRGPNNIFLSVGRGESFINGGEIPANYVEISGQIFIPQKIVPGGICSTSVFFFFFLKNLSSATRSSIYLRMSLLGKKTDNLFTDTDLKSTVNNSANKSLSMEKPRSEKRKKLMIWS